MALRELGHNAKKRRNATEGVPYREIWSTTMNTWRSLLWKEWREQRAVGLAILAVLVLVPTITSFAELGGLHFGIYFTTILTMPMFAVFVGMGIASGEHSRGTMPFLQALPATTRGAAAAKLFAGLLTLWFPILAATALYAGWIELTEERKSTIC